jgi:hypothetical protein
MHVALVVHLHAEQEFARFQTVQRFAFNPGKR